MSHPTHTAPAHVDTRWDSTEAETRATDVVAVNVDERYELVEVIHLAFPNLRFASSDVVQNYDGTWTFPIPRAVLDLVHYDDSPFDIQTYTDEGEPEISFVITAGQNV